MNQTVVDYMNNYDLENILVFVLSYFNSINFDELINDKNDLIILKPNLVIPAKPEDAITTHPHIIEAIIIALINRGYTNIGIGDSGIKTESTKFPVCGITHLCEKYKCRLLDFDKEAKTIILKEKNKWLKKVPVSESIKKAKLIINVPKAKTHQGYFYSGAIKNLYGLVYGNDKRLIHQVAHDKYIFEEIIIDVCRTFSPTINIMDCIVGMEGNGPISGQKKNLGMLIASNSALALDMTFLKKLNTSYEEVGYISKFTDEVNLANQISDPFPELILEWRWPDKSIVGCLFIDKVLCKYCTECSKVCPKNAIVFNELQQCYVIDDKICIKCYCCTEACRFGAIHKMQ